MSTTFILISVIYLTLVAICYVWILGLIHAADITQYTLLNNRPEHGLALQGALSLIFGVIIAYTVFKPGLKWTWPKRGVTYDLPEDL